MPLRYKIERKIKLELLNQSRCAHVRFFSPLCSDLLGSGCAYLSSGRLIYLLAFLSASIFYSMTATLEKF
jgi:hypothetical protein